ncbi:unnamed protein product [Cylicocyclus nassatus]|uniref:Integrator complex subunit 14 C-terminal domain-containing protein n=1 Tax=Cylicocyclus nassatus TaxID=53992 RepID=A0AA36DUY1_CYLNA|nr:unnamed protein product [Cylicocyclus nassatus]
MTIYFIVDGHQSNILSKPEKFEEIEKKNSLYIQILKELFGVLASRQSELGVEVFWGNTSCIRTKASDGKIIPTLEETMSRNRGSLHLGRLFDKLRPTMNSDDAVVLLTDAAMFKGDITSYPRGMMFSIVVDTGAVNSDQMAELNELSTTCNSEMRSEGNQKHWVLRYSEYSSVSAMVAELMNSLQKPDYTTLFIGNLSASIQLQPSTDKDLPDNIEVIGFVRSANMMNIPVDGVQFITTCTNSQSKSSSENRPPEVDDSPHFVTTEDQDSDDLLGTLGPALVETESVALVLISDGQYGCITAEKVGDNFCLVLNKLPENLPDFIPNFSNLESGPDEQAGPLHFTTLQGVAPSYNPVVQSWVTEHGFNMDFQKMFRLLRKLPDRPHLFYQEVNRFRKYALAIGMDHVLFEAARIIREEIKQLNATAQTHGAYVATAFEKENPRSVPEILQWGA